MKMSKGKKRFLIACAAVLVAGITLAVTLMNDIADVVATQKVFDGMRTNFSTLKQVNILEIVPTSDRYTGQHDGKNYDLNTKSELGYFMPLSISNKCGTYNASDMAGAPTNPLYVSRGAVHGAIDYFDASNASHDNSAYKSHIYNMYQYGLVKPSGSDAGWYTGLGEYPLYSRTGLFSPYKVGYYDQLLSGRLVDGYYVYNKTNTGNYYIDPSKYYINENDDNKIYKVDGVSTNSLPGTVSVNDIDGSVLHVSGNTIADINTSELSLPKDSDGVPIVEDRTETGDGNVDFRETEGVLVPYQLYKGFSGNKLYFSTNNQMQFKNSDWWNEYVMGDLKEYEDVGVDTPYTVKAARDVTVDDIKNADLIYISGTYETFTTAEFEDGTVGSDISADVLIQIYNDEVNYKHKAVMMDYAVYDGSLGNNISKLAALLWQKSQSSFYTNNEEDHPTWFTTGKVTDIAKGSNIAKEQSYHNLNLDALSDTALWTAAKEAMVPAGTGNGNFVTGNTYVYNHHMSDFTSPKAMLDALDNFANGDFKTPYTSTVVTQGLNAVSRYIEATNKNSVSEMLSTDITPAVCIQYILVSEGIDLDVMKTSLRVLEIEPVPAFLYNTQRGTQEYAELSDSVATEKTVKENRNEFVKKYLSAFYTEDDRISFIEFTSMTVYEFNARNEDLVETYDIIYIGDETTRNGKNLYYTDGAERNTLVWNDDEKNYGYELKKTSNIPNFRDENMIGNLYYNVGDKVEVFGSFQNGDTDGVSGWLDNDTFKNRETITARYSPRDITKNKLDKLKEFVESNALVLVAEDLMGTPTGDVKNTQVNPTIVTGNADENDIYGRVDNSSNLYNFLSFAIGKTYTVSSNGLGNYVSTADSKAHKNVVAVSDIKQGLIDKELLAEFVSTEKLVLNLIEKPTPYTYSAQSNGVITSSAYLETVNSDGTRYLEYKFTIEGDNEKTAALGYSVSLYVDINKDGKFSKTTENVQDVVIRLASNGQEAVKNEANEYVLSPGVEYVLRRDIADDFSGLLNWKLDVKSNAISHLHDSETGYTLVKDANDKKRKIRILQITNDSSTLDMEGRLYNARTTNTTNNWGVLMNNVPDYDLYIRTITVTQYQTALTNKYNEYVAKVNEDNAELPEGQKITAMTSTEYAEKAYDTFFNDFVVQNVDIANCSETPIDHKTTGPDAKDVKGSVLKNKGYENEIGVDMIVCGFGDDYKAFTSSEAMVALQAFIKMGKPVLTSHDFVHFRIGTSQNRVLRNSFGADLYGVTQNLTVTNDPLTGKPKVSMFNAWNPETVTTDADFKAQRVSTGLGYLHSSVGYSRAANADVFSVIENTGKEVSYLPNSLRNTTTPETQGLSSMLIEWNRNYTISGKSWMNANNVSAGKTVWNSGGQNDLGDDKKYMVEQVNEGQITNYPYRLKKSFRTTATHSQYYSLDLTSDLDDDGESDVVVWYALGDSNMTNPNAWGNNPYNELSGGSINPANGYYIYNDGNITYTGAGHKNLTSAGLDEVELFINTLIAAYETGVSNPSIGFYNSPDVNEKPITSVIVPYDGNVTNPDKGSVNKFDSSILKAKGSSEYMYKFVDPNTESSKGVTAADGTMIYYRVGDYNFVRGTKNITTRYYLQVPSVIEDEENGKLYYKMPDGTKLDVVSLDVGGTTVSAVDISKRIYTYSTSGMVVSDTAMDRNKDGSVGGVESGRAYGFYLPMNLLNDNAAFTILVEAQTTIISVSTSGYGKNTTTEKAYQALSVVKADLLDLD